MQTFEYKFAYTENIVGSIRQTIDRRTSKAEREQLKEVLDKGFNKLGEEGWELVTAIPLKQRSGTKVFDSQLFVFKRPTGVK